MKKFLFSALMAALAMPMMQAIDRPESFIMLRGGKAPVPATLVKSANFGAKSMTRGATTWDFEDQAQIADWTFVDNDGDNYGWNYYNNTGLETGKMTCHSGEGVMASQSYDNDTQTALTPDNWMISPVMELGGTLKFWAMGQDANYCAEVFAVYVCVGDPSDINNFVQVGVDYTATSDWVEYKFDLTPYQGQNGCFAIRHYKTSDLFMLNVDDVTLNTDEIIIPDPTTPTNLTADPKDVTALIAWEDTDDNAWNLRYRVYNPNVAQHFHWSAEADEDLSEWRLMDADGDGNCWGVSAYSGAPDGSNIFFSESYASGTVLDPDNWLFTPEVKMGGTLTFWAGCYYFPDKFEVYIVPDIDDEATWVKVMDLTAPADAYEGAGEYFTVDLSQYEGNARIAFRHTESSDNYYLFLDDINYDVPGEEANEWIYIYNLDDTEVILGDLDPETTYEVQVQAYNENQVESEWSESTIFTTAKSTVVDELNSEKAVAGVRYFNAAGQEMAQPEGMTIVVTTYTDGTKVATKVIK